MTVNHLAQDFDTDMVPKFKEQIAQLKDLIFNKVCWAWR